MESWFVSIMYFQQVYSKFAFTKNASNKAVLANSDRPKNIDLRFLLQIATILMILLEIL